MDTLANDQAKALDSIMRWANPENDSEWFMTLGGYAGTGKTFLMQYLVGELDRNVICATPTGKAAEVLKRKMPKGVKVCTIHHLLYSPVETSLTIKISHLEFAIERMIDDGKDTRSAKSTLTKLKNKLEKEGDEEDVDFINSPHEVLLSKPLIIVDEASMVTMRMFDDFERTGCQVLFVGDPFQLPPVNPNDDPNGRSVLETHPPTVELTEIKRQALESPIIRLAHAIRHGENPMKHIDGKNTIKVPRSRVTAEHYARAGQVICGTNKTRYAINRDTRAHYRRSHSKLGINMPVKGDKLICTMNKDKYRWINGVIHEAVSDLKQGEYGPIIDVMYQDELRQNVEVYDYNFRCNYADPKQISEYKITDWREKQMLTELDYAYAITCHKSQGSEWDKVLVIQDWFFADKERWLYTAVTRAKEKLLWAA